MRGFPLNEKEERDSYINSIMRSILCNNDTYIEPPSDITSTRDTIKLSDISYILGGLSNTKDKKEYRIGNDKYTMEFVCKEDIEHDKHIICNICYAQDYYIADNKDDCYIVEYDIIVDTYNNNVRRVSGNVLNFG